MDLGRFEESFYFERTILIVTIVHHKAGIGCASGFFS